jgi:HD superfamily phosphohydrolase
MAEKKIFNDPVHGFMSFEFDILYELIDHPYFQRLRRISQMGLSSVVYPGAVHTRFHHALGALHLMSKALNLLERKGVIISIEEKEAVQIAILLHDIGHGPFSHALEYKILPIHHEEITILIMDLLNEAFDGRLSLAIKIFKGEYERKFLYQLVSSQIDVDRLDYLTRDSFFTGVTEGAIGYDRIINMFNVEGEELVVEEKAFYTIERYLQSRKFMYAQVYLHKTSVAAECMLKSFFARLRYLLDEDEKKWYSFFPSNSDFFQLLRSKLPIAKVQINQYLNLDDIDVYYLLKKAKNADDKVLNILANSILDRRIFKMLISDNEIDELTIENAISNVVNKYQFTHEEVAYFVIKGEETVSSYEEINNEIMIKKKSGEIIPFSKFYSVTVSNNYLKKYYLCYII